MSPQHQVHARGPADLLALVPSLLGFHPEQSVVVLTIGPADRPFHARADLPADAVELEDLADHLSEVAVRNGVRRLACVVYSDDAGLAESFADALGTRARAVGVEPVCAVRADGQRWWTPGSGPDDPGTPYDVATHPLMMEAVVEGTVVLANRQELADSLLADDPQESAIVLARADEALARLSSLLGSCDEAERRARLVAEGRWVRIRVRRFLEDGCRLDARDVARLATLVTVSTEVRDVAWAELTHRNADRHVALWRDVVRRVPTEARAAPAALLGFAAWIAGDGALAWCAVDCAQKADPGYGLATLLSEALTRAVPPSTWRPFPRSDLSLFAQ